MGINLDFTVEDLFVNKDELSNYLCQVCMESVIDFKKLTKKNINNSQINKSLEFEALQCKNGHISCYECWTRQLLEFKKKECPTCKCKLENLDCLSRNIFLENTFRKNLVYCPYIFKESKYNDQLVKDDLGCRAKITIDEFDHHIKVCQYKFCKCPNNKNKCLTITRKNLISSHNEVCDYFPTPCDKCDELVEKSSLLQHQQTKCQGIKEQCSLCLEYIGRTHLKDHNDHGCKKTIIECLYKNGGCLDKFERGQLKEHLIKYDSHLFYIQNMMDKEKNKFEEFNNEFKKIILANQQLEKRINYLETIVSLNRDSSTTNLQRYIGKWTVHNWDAKVRAYPNGKSFNSPFFYIGSHKFFIMIYPCGNGDARNFVSIFLYKIFDQPTNIKYSFEAKNSDPTKNYKNTHTNYFTTNNGNGWFRFIDSKASLNSGFFTNNQLTIHIKVQVLPKEELITTD